MTQFLGECRTTVHWKMCSVRNGGDIRCAALVQHCVGEKSFSPKMHHQGGHKTVLHSQGVGTTSEGEPVHLHSVKNCVQSFLELWDSEPVIFGVCGWEKREKSVGKEEKKEKKAFAVEQRTVTAKSGLRQQLAAQKLCGILQGQ